MARRRRRRKAKGVKRYNAAYGSWEKEPKRTKYGGHVWGNYKGAERKRKPARAYWE